MPDAITTASVQQYKANVELLLQQTDARIRGAVSTDSYRGKAAAFIEQFGSSEAVQVTTRHGDTTLVDGTQQKRWVFPKDFEWGRLIDHPDVLRMIIDPTSPYVMEGAAAMNRAMDREILTAMFATNYIGENGTTTEAFNTTDYQVAVAVGGAASSLNVAKLQSAVQKLMLAHKGEVFEPVKAAISSYEHDALLKEVQIANRDFNSAAVLENGRVKRFMGVDYIITELLSITSGNRLIPIWVPSGMHFGTWDEATKVRVSERADKRHAMQVYYAGTFGASRTQPGKLIQVLCDDQI